MGNYPTSHLTLYELTSQVLNDPKATNRERDLAERMQRVREEICDTFVERRTDNVGRGGRG